MSSPACADSEGYDTPRQQREDTTIFMVAKDSYEACHGNHIEMPQSAAAGVARLGALRLTHRTWKHWPGGSTFPSLPVPHASNLAWHLTSESNSPHAGCTLLHGWGSAASFVIASLSKKKKKLASIWSRVGLSLQPGIWRLVLAAALKSITGYTTRVLP